MNLLRPLIICFFFLFEFLTNAQFVNKSWGNCTLQQKKVDPYTMTVALDGSGDFTSIQSAIDNAKSFPYERVMITIKNGVYNEKVTIPAWNSKVSLIGESIDKTIISFDDHFKKINRGRNSTFFSATLSVEADDFIAENLTIRNTAGEVGQAIAVSVSSNNAFFHNCSIEGNQDTLYVAGSGNKQHFKGCYIEGTTDFIFGGATALFENCTIYSKKDSYVTAASTPKESHYGLVFLHCNFTAADHVKKVYLGRPWRIYAKTVIINCNLGNHIAPEGWHDWSKPESQESVYFAEYQNTGEGSKINERIFWSRQLTKFEAKKYTKKRIID